MIKSMTGYGRGGGSGNGFSFCVELRSVNHRYADFNLRMPRELYPLEERIRRILQAALKRGRVEVLITLEEVPAGTRQVMVDYDLADAYNRVLRELAGRFGLPGELDLGALVQLPDLLSLQGTRLPEESVWPSLEKALEEALTRLLLQREDEGKNLLHDLAGRSRRVGELVRAAAEQAKRAQGDSRARVEKKFAEFLTGQFEENRVLMECALLVERMCIDEELVRLESHLEAFTRTLTAAGPAGRKLDFFAQEMFREINTIGSKAGDSRLTGLVVEMKSEMEKMREQIANIE